MAASQPITSATGRYPKQTIDLAGESILVFDVLAFHNATVQIVDQSGASHTGNTITVSQSNDGNNPQAFASPVTFSAAGISSLLDVSGFGYLHVRVTTVGSGSGTCDVFVTAKRE